MISGILSAVRMHTKTKCQGHCRRLILYPAPIATVVDERIARGRIETDQTARKL